MGFLKSFFEPAKPTKWQIKIVGTVHRCGTVPVHDTFVTDNVHEMRGFIGPKRYDVITGWLNVHYPGSTFNPRQFSVQIKPVKE